MAIGRISGRMLKDNLERDNSLTFNIDTLAIDYANSQVGIGTASPESSLQVVGTTKLANIQILDSTISTIGNANIILSPSGSGTIDVDSNYITNVNDPIRSQDAATKAYVDSQTSSSSFTIADTSNNAQSITTGDTLTVSGTANEVEVTVSSPDTVTIGLPDNVVIIGNLSAGNIITTDSITTNELTSTGTLTVTGNITGGNFITSGTATVGSIEVAVTGTADFGGILLNNVADPISDQDAATKAYVDNSLSVSLGNLEIFDTAIVTASGTDNIILDAEQGIVVIDGTSGFLIPVGNTAQRPTSVDEGTVRWNSETSILEVYDGTEWSAVGKATVLSETFDGDNSTTSFTLSDDNVTTENILVSLNGVLQLPTTAYSVTGNVVTFTEAPAVGDRIEVRLLQTLAGYGGTYSDADVASYISSYTGNITANNVTLTGILQSPQATKASNATGTTGQISWDADYIYVCTATNTWKRVALTGGY